MISLAHEFKAITELTIISFDYISFKCFKDNGNHFSIADAMSVADIMFVKNAHLTEIVASEKSIYITSNTI